MPMLKFVEALIEEFRPVFRRKATFEWFVVVLSAMTVRMDMAGVTSIVRCLGLSPKTYHSLLHFFHSTAFSVSALCQRWSTILDRFVTPVTLNGAPLYVLDGLKMGKEGKKMPGVKLMHQESTDNTKPEYIMGHFWGALSMLVQGSPKHVYAMPLRFQIQDGLKRSTSEVATLIDKMGTLVNETLPDAAGGYVMGDIYYSTLKFLTAVMQSGKHYLGKVKFNTVAYEPPVPPSGPRRRGRPRKYGAKVKLNELFSQPERFEVTTLDLYGGAKEVAYCCLDLIWQGIEVRFVLSVLQDGRRSILMTTDRTLAPELVIYAYGLRQKIEVSFQALIHTLCGFGYHFWMMEMPKLKWGSGNQYLHRAGDRFRKQVYRKIEAYERFVNISAIALGILQLLSIHFPALIWTRFPVWLRTLTRHGCPTEHVVRLTLQHELHQSFLKHSDSLLLQKILATKEKGRNSAHPMKLAA